MEKIKIMIWRDIIINCRPENVEIVSALAKIFDIREDKIDVIDAIENSQSNQSVICVLFELFGHFCLMLSFYLDFKVDNEILLIAQICDELNCEALITNDNTENPYSMFLVDGEGKSCEVSIDPDKLDEYEEYKITNYTSTH